MRCDVLSRPFSLLSLVAVFGIGCGGGQVQQSEGGDVLGAGGSTVLRTAATTGDAASVLSDGTSFGLNYWPAGYHNDCLWSDNWPACQSIVARDLDHMASLGARVVRLMFWPGQSGYTDRHTFSAQLNEVAENLPKLLAMLKDRGLVAIIVLGNAYLNCLNDLSCDESWGWAYKYCPHYSDCSSDKDAIAAFTDFVMDSRHWVDTIVAGVEASPAADIVLFYDLQNEVRPYRNKWTDWYVTFLSGQSAVPAAKRGLSIMIVEGEDNETLMAEQLGPTVSAGLRFTDFHANENQDIAATYAKFRQLFPHSTTILGELSAGTASRDEVAQQPIVIDKWRAAKAQHIPLALVWSWMDNGPRFSEQYFGLLHSWEAPKDVLGALATELAPSGVGNMDMEAIDEPTGRPIGWQCFGGSCGSVSEALTNDRALRATSSDCQGDISVMTGGTAAVTPGSKIFANAYLRTNLRDVRLEIVEFDQSGQRLEMQSTPIETPSSWQWINAIWRSRPQIRRLSAATTAVRLRVTGTKQCNNQLQVLDVDTASIATIN